MMIMGERVGVVATGLMPTRQIYYIIDPSLCPVLVFLPPVVLHHFCVIKINLIMDDLKHSKFCRTLSCLKNLTVMNCDYVTCQA